MERVELAQPARCHGVSLSLRRRRRRCVVVYSRARFFALHPLWGGSVSGVGIAL